MPPSVRCRENFRRSIAVDGDIDDNLLRALTPRVLELRQQSADPITLYIDSRGGDPRIADALMNLLTAPDVDGTPREVVTVVTRTAASAAANLLVSGTYVIAYANTHVFFHGLRYADLPETTFEMAIFAARFLRESNETRALSLASKVIERILLLYAVCRQRIEELRQQENSPSTTDIEYFVRIISAELTMRSGQLCNKALQKYLELERSSNYVFNHVSFATGASLGTMRCQVLQAVIEDKLEQHRHDSGWSFTDDETGAAVDDFTLIIDYKIGSNHKIAVRSIARRMYQFLLSASELIELDTLRDRPEQERDDWLVGRVTPILEPLWYFTVSVCRLLQLDENPLTALDAYWLGLINEVLGAQLPSLRVILENPPATDAELPLTQSQPSDH